MTGDRVETLEHNGVRLALERIEGRAPTFVWLGGFKSDMGGAKVRALAEWARSCTQAFVRFDYSGHGRSGGKFEEGTIGRWLGDALAVIDAHTRGPLVLVGSSMGAWIALLAARERPARVSALLLIAPAVDFTERLMWAAFPEEVRRQILKTGRWERPSAYDPEPHVVTRALIEDGRKWLVMDAPLPFPGRVRILHGALDPDVPVSHARAVAAVVTSPDSQFMLIEDGDHRLSRPQDLARLIRVADELAGAR